MQLHRNLYGKAKENVIQKKLFPITLIYFVYNEQIFLETQRLSRKEVFQPHLPVRLPCYDLAPVTSFTLGRS